MNVLRTWDEVGTSIIKLQEQGLPLHRDFQKNWDLLQILLSMQEFKEGSIVDLGCGGNFTLNLLRRAGFKSLVGIDLSVPKTGFGSTLRGVYRRYRPRLYSIPMYRLVRGNILGTPFQASSFDAAVCLSVVEHDVNPELFFRETSRILKDGARLYLSTDYWEPSVDTSQIKYGNMPWRILDRSEIERLVAVGRRFGFLVDGDEVPEVGEPLVYNKGKHYTFISMTFTLSKSRRS